jgi:hypothetical protein
MAPSRRGTRKSVSPNNHVAEWFGHRIYPTVAATPESLQDQLASRCPFLTGVKRVSTECIKRPASKGVCTISSTSNGSRQDWLVCPYRVFTPSFMQPIARRLFGADGGVLWTHAAPTLTDDSVKAAIVERLTAGDHVLVYFDEKVGGEISLAGTPQSPEMSFDVTFIELLLKGDSIELGRFAIVEVQTIDFHGSYRAAVTALRHALDLHPEEFPKQVEGHPEWAARDVEGPNIANVVKRTFWQMLFKFKFGETDLCAGTALAIPQAVWDSWQPFLGRPELNPTSVPTVSHLAKPGEDLPAKIPAWIYVFEADASSSATPNPINFTNVIGTSAAALDHYALTEAPERAKEALLAETGLYSTLRRRLRLYWPDLVPAPPRKPRRRASDQS